MLPLSNPTLQVVGRALATMPGGASSFHLRCRSPLARLGWEVASPIHEGAPRASRQMRRRWRVSLTGLILVLLGPACDLTPEPSPRPSPPESEASDPFREWCFSVAALGPHSVSKVTGSDPTDQAGLKRAARVLASVMVTASPKQGEMPQRSCIQGIREGLENHTLTHPSPSRVREDPTGARGDARVASGEFCSRAVDFVGVSGIADQFGAKNDSLPEVARAVVKEFPRAIREDALEGCLEGLKG